MIYSWMMAQSQQGHDPARFRYVTSTNGKTWHGHGTCANSLTVNPEYLEQHQIFMLGGKCVLLYETGNNTTAWAIRSAVAPACEGPFTEGARNPFLTPTRNGTNWDAVTPGPRGLAFVEMANAAEAKGRDQIHERICFERWADEVEPLNQARPKPTPPPIAV